PFEWNDTAIAGSGRPERRTLDALENDRDDRACRGSVPRRRGREDEARSTEPGLRGGEQLRLHHGGARSDGIWMVRGPGRRLLRPPRRDARQRGRRGGVEGALRGPPGAVLVEAGGRGGAR